MYILNESAGSPEAIGQFAAGEALKLEDGMLERGVIAEKLGLDTRHAALEVSDKDLLVH